MDMSAMNTIVQGDCIVGMRQLPAGSAQLVFADPPFNIGYDYDVYDDKLETQTYLEWSRQWIQAVYDVLTPTGTFWLAIGDEYAAELKMLSEEIGFHTRSWVVWYYTFGVNCRLKYTRSHAHLFYFVKDSADFVFHHSDPQNRIPSARQLVYNDKRANPVGRLPDDTWMIRPDSPVGQFHLTEAEALWDVDGQPLGLTPADVERTWTLRPQDLAERFQPDEDTWYFPRVAGTFKERAGFHGCQMPEQLLGRIIRGCSNENDVVMDPFSGSATTIAVAKKLGRRHLGFELSEDYARQGLTRLEAIRVGDRLDGSAEPTTSAPATASSKSGKRGESDGKKAAKTKLATQGKLPFVDESAAETIARQELFQRVAQGVATAYTRLYTGRSVEHLLVDPSGRAEFLAECRRLALAGDDRSWCALLFRLRQAGAFAGYLVADAAPITRECFDACLSGAELAWRRLSDQGASSLDEILCDPLLLEQFDRLATELSPGGGPFQYRWALIALRRQIRKARIRSAVVSLPKKWSAELTDLANCDYETLPTSAGYFEFHHGDQPWYVGDTLNLRMRLTSLLSGDMLQEQTDRAAEAWKLSYREIEIAPDDMLVYAAAAAQKLQPGGNASELWSGLDAVESCERDLGSIASGNTTDVQTDGRIFLGSTKKKNKAKSNRAAEVIASESDQG